MEGKRLPKYLLASVLISNGGLLNGLDTGSIGAMTNMPQFIDSIGELSPFLLGFTVSLIMLTGSVPSIMAGHLADKFGRLKTILLGAIMFGIGVVLQGAAGTLPQFLVGRAVAGLGEGVYLTNVSVYITEIAPAKSRGMLAGMPQFMATTGVCVGYFICYGTVHIQSSMAWRLPYVIQGALALAFGVSCLVLPESPRWLMLHGKRDEAIKALRQLDFSMDEAESGFLLATEQRPSMSPWQSFKLLFTRSYRARTILALFVLGMVQLSGIDGVIYYAPVLFAQAGLSSATASFLASGVSAILMLAISIPAFMFADKWGRRTSTISGGIILSGCMLLMGILYAAGVVHSYGVARWVVIVSVFVFGMTYCATWGLVGKIYASEIQPSHTRGTANSVASGLSFFANWLVAILTPILLDKSAFGAYFLFGGLALGTVLVLAAYMPETRGRSLENIQEAFHQPKLKSVGHYVRQLFPAMRHRTNAATGSSGEAIELDQSRRETPSTTSSVDAAARGLRIDMVSA